MDRYLLLIPLLQIISDFLRNRKLKKIVQLSPKYDKNTLASYLYNFNVLQFRRVFLPLFSHFTTSKNTKL